MDQDTTRKVHDLEADRAALLLLVAALMKSHPDQGRLHLNVTSMLERQLGGGTFTQLLDAGQQARVRELVEWMGVLLPKPG